MSYSERIESKIFKTDGCWLWQGNKNTDGYGQIKFNGKTCRVHRLVYEHFFGEIAPDMVIMHICDNPACVNPDHLKMATIKENNNDCDRKGRRNPPIGTRAHKAKLTDEQVIKIRELYANGNCTYKHLSARFGVTEAMIGYIIRRDHWKHL